MNKVIKTALTLCSIAIATITATAQEKTMYIMKNGEVTYEILVSDVDSVIFYKPARVIPEGAVLINGVYWATCNVDAPGTFAATPESSGQFYQWNRNIGWSTENPLVNSNGGTTWNSTVPVGYTWEKANDPCPTGYRLPTNEENKSLFDVAKVTNVYTEQNGVNGRIFTDKISGTSIFMSAFGFRNAEGELQYSGYTGRYWSSTQIDCSRAYGTYFYYSETAIVAENNRLDGRLVRCVAK